MAGGEVLPPSESERRFERLAGGPDERRIDYLLRRHLGTTRAKLLQRPWWEYELVIEGLVAEFSQPGGAQAPAEAPVAPAAPTDDLESWNPWAEGQYVPPGEAASLADLAALGLNTG